MSSSGNTYVAEQTVGECLVDGEVRVGGVGAVDGRQRILRSSGQGLILASRLKQGLQRCVLLLGQLLQGCIGCCQNHLMDEDIS